MSVDEKALAFFGKCIISVIFIVYGFNGLRKNSSTPSPSVKQLKRGDYGEKVFIPRIVRPEIFLEDQRYFLGRPTIRDPIDGTTRNYGSMYEMHKMQRNIRNSPLFRF